jgi:hypothetical protein
MTDKENQRVDAFFQGYAAAFSHLDPSKVSRFWSIPAVVAGPGYVKSFVDREAFDENSRKLCAFYAAQGLAKVQARLVRCERFFDTRILAIVGYEIFDKAGLSLLKWEHLYFLEESQGELRATFALADGEIAAWQAAGHHFGSSS